MIVSVVIPTKNGALTLDSCLENIFKQKHNFTLEIIIIDSGSIDKTLDIAKKYPVKIKSIKPEEFNHGLTRNYGISIAMGNLVVLMVQDAIPYDEYWLSNMIREFKDKRVAGVYCRQIPRANCDPLKAIQLREGFSGGNIRKVKLIGNIEDYKNLSPMEKYELVSFDNVCSGIRKSVWGKIPFAKVNFAEDLHWSREVLMAGYKIVYTPDATVIHSHNRSFMNDFKRDFICHKTMYKMFALHTVPRIRLKDSFVIIIDTWKLLWRNNYRLKYWKYYLASPIHYLASHFAQYYGAKSAKRKLDYEDFECAT